MKHVANVFCLLLQIEGASDVPVHAWEQSAAAAAYLPVTQRQVADNSRGTDHWGIPQPTVRTPE